MKEREQDEGSEEKIPRKELNRRKKTTWAETKEKQEIESESR